jgi:hypothetical protein
VVFGLTERGPRYNGPLKGPVVSTLLRSVICVATRRGNYHLSIYHPSEGDSFIGLLCLGLATCQVRTTWETELKVLCEFKLSEGLNESGILPYSYFQNGGPLFTCIYLCGPPRFDSGVHS